MKTSATVAKRDTQITQNDSPQGIRVRLPAVAPTKKDFARIVAKSTSYRDLARNLGYRETGSHSKRLIEVVKLLNLNTSHFSHQHINGLWIKNTYTTTQSKVTDEAFAQAIASNTSLRQALMSLGLKAIGQAYNIANRRIQRLGLSTTHFLPYSPQGTKLTRRPLSAYLVKDGPQINPSKLRKRLVNEGIKSGYCEECGLPPVWRDKPLSMHLDHKSGDRTDNRKQNLQILCPNCHSQTITYGKIKLK